jgi:GT2 family glycosyltransferase
LNWNGLLDTVQCLESIQRLKYENYEVVVVDNGSGDNSAAYLKKNYPWIVLIENVNNLGYAGGNGVGMRYAVANNADYLWLLNNDTVVHTDSLRNLVSMTEASPAIGLASPIIFYFDQPNRWQFAGSYFDWKTFSLKYPHDRDEVAEKFQTGEDGERLY